MSGNPAAFQVNAFQNSAFQTGDVTPPPPPDIGVGHGAGGAFRNEGRKHHRHIERYSYGRSNNQIEEIARHIAALMESEREEPSLTIELQPVDQLLIQQTISAMEDKRLTLTNIERVLRQMIREIEEDDDETVLLLMS